MSAAKRCLATGVIAVLLLMMTACGQSSESVTAGSTRGEGNSSKEEQVKLVFAHGYNEMDYRAQGYQKWVELVEELSDGSIKIEVHPGGTLVPLPEGYDATSTGTVDLYANASVYLSPRIPELEVLDPPGVYDPNKWIEMDEATAPLIDEILNEHNMKYLHNDYQGELAVITNRAKPVIKKEDWKGLVLRDAGGALGEMVSGMGASPVAIPLGELPSALSSGLADGTAIGLSAINSLKLYEMLDSVSIHSTTNIASGMLTMNLDSWNGLSPAQQEVLIEAGKQAQPIYEELGKAMYEEAINNIESEGLKIHMMAVDEEKPLKEMSKQVTEKIYNNVNEKGKELYEIIRDFQ